MKTLIGRFVLGRRQFVHSTSPSFAPLVLITALKWHSPPSILFLQTEKYKKNSAYLSKSTKRTAEVLYPENLMRHKDDYSLRQFYHVNESHQ